jgi:hypothetical protein
LVFHPIGGFNPEALTVMVMQLMEWDVDSVEDIETIFDPLFLMRTFMVVANHGYLAIHRAIIRAFEAVVGAVTTTSMTQGTGAPLFAPNHRRHDKWQIQALQPANHRHTIKASVKIKSFDPHPLLRDLNSQISHRCH